jgi:glycosyltransferase involved in cell wall biosynthesis
MATVDLVIPCYNEAHVLAGSVERTLSFLGDHPEHEWRIVVADNASTDRTLEVARELEAQHPGAVVALHIPVKGRGLALRTAWLTSDADVHAYMDVDLSTDLGHLSALVDPLAADEADLSYGSRLASESETERGWRREVISRSYVQILRWGGGLRVSDAQCGFKAIRREVARSLLPVVEDTGFFFDSELLIVAQRNGYRLCEVSVKWTDDPDSRVNVWKTALSDLRGLWRLCRHGVPAPVGAGPRQT